MRCISPVTAPQCRQEILHFSAVVPCHLGQLFQGLQPVNELDFHGPLVVALDFTEQAQIQPPQIGLILQGQPHTVVGLSEGQLRQPPGHIRLGYLPRPDSLLQRRRPVFLIHNHPPFHPIPPKQKKLHPSVQPQNLNCKLPRPSCHLTHVVV